MKAELRILSGARAGQVIPVGRQAVIGRDTEAEVRFDPHTDLEVSARHAIVTFDGAVWQVRDLGSRNGTFVNGRRVGEAKLEDGDRLSFGWQGPEVEFRLATGTGSAHGTAIASTLRWLREGSGAAIVRENRRLKWIAGGLFAVLVLVVSYATWVGRSQRSGWLQERAQLLERIDSVLSAGDASAAALTGEREGLALALEQSREEVRRVRGELERAGNGDTSAVPDLRRQLQSAIAALGRQQLAASVDYEAVERVARRAVAVIWVEAADGTVSTGTAFAVRPDATLVTSRHVLTGPANRDRPRRLAIQFSDSEQVWPARILHISESDDLAVVRAENILGEVPTVSGLNLRPDTLGSGVPIVWIGFPLGGETWPQDERTGRIARPLGAVGVITRIESSRIEVQGYGAVGASGSPILDETGAVVAALFGTESRNGVQTLIGVPSTVIDRVLRQLQPAQ